ncbi:DUF2147 domain-containing protein [Halocola ammonii]
MKSFLAAFTFTLLSLSLLAQDATIFGKWKTIDDNTGKVRSIVEIYEKDGKAYGRIVKLFRTPDQIQDPVCKNCEDDRKGEKVLGLEIIRGMEKDDDEWEDGTILDPESGKIYDCSIWLDEDDPNTLNVRGYIAFFYRTQNWKRVE